MLGTEFLGRQHARNSHIAAHKADAYALIMSNLAIQQMSWEEHGDALRETEQLYAAGNQEPIDWAIARQELGKRRNEAGEYSYPMKS